MDSRKLVSPRQAFEDEVGHRGKKIAPGFYWAGFGDAGYRRNVVRGLIGLAVVVAIRLVA
jgi:hypothetical protein